MLIMYPNARGDSTFTLILALAYLRGRQFADRYTDVTLSPRIGSKTSEPTVTSKVSINMLPGTRINDDELILHARCTNCRRYIDVENTLHPMIYAFGNGHNLMSNSPSAGLKRHVRYGHFTMNMQTATGTGGVPVKSNALNGVSIPGDMTKDRDRASLAHAVVGCVALFVLWPLNVFAAGFFKNIKIHFILGGIIMAFLIVSYALGGVTSAQYIRVSFPHKVLPSRRKEEEEEEKIKKKPHIY